MSDLNFTGNVRRLRLRPGDYVVVELPGHVSMQQARTLREQLEAVFPENTAIFMVGGTRIAAVLRPEDQA